MKINLKISIFIGLCLYFQNVIAIHIIDVTKTTTDVRICINDTVGLRVDCGFTDYIWKDNGDLITGGIDPTGKTTYKGDNTCMLIVAPPPTVTLLWSFIYEVCFDSLGTIVCRNFDFYYDIPEHATPNIGDDFFSCGNTSTKVNLINTVACAGCVDTWYPGGQNGDTLKDQSNGIYYFEAVKPNGFSLVSTCISRSKKVEVQINPYPIISTIPDKNICNGETVTLTSSVSNNVGVTFAWDGDAADLNLTNIQSPTASISSPATRTYRLIVTDTMITACKDTALVSITMFSPLSINLGYTDTTICGSNPINLKANISGGLPKGNGSYNYSWFQYPDNSFYSAAQNPSVQTLVKKNFVLTVSDSLGCNKKSDTVSIDVTDLSISSPLDSLNICADDSVRLFVSGSGGKGILTYSWLPIIDLATPNKDSTWCYAQSPKTYTGRVTDSVGCFREHKIYVNAISLPFIQILNPNDTFCLNVPVDIKAQVSGGSGEGYVYNWKIVSLFDSKDTIYVDPSNIQNDTLSNAIFIKKDKDAVRVEVSVVDSKGCASDVNVPGVVSLWGIEPPTSNESITYPNIDLIFENDLITFESNANSFDSLYWIFENNTPSNFGELNVIRSFADSGNYTSILRLVKLTAPNGSVACALDDSLDFYVRYKFTPLVHNVFTPNGDNINETLWIDYLEYYGENELILFNRWGNEIYRTTNYQNDWKGDNLPDGTYYYQITAEGDFKSPHRGSFMIIR